MIGNCASVVGRIHSAGVPSVGHVSVLPNLGPVRQKGEGRAAPNTANSDRMFSVDRHAAVDCCSRYPSSRVVFRPLRDERTVKNLAAGIVVKECLASVGEIVSADGVW